MRPPNSLITLRASQVFSKPCRPLSTVLDHSGGSGSDIDGINMAEDRSADEAPITFNVKSSSDAKYVLTLPLTTTVIDLKQKLSTAEYADLTPDRQRLIYSGRVLKDPDTLGSYKIRDGHTVHLVKGAASNQRQNPANQGSSANTGPSSSSPTATGVPSNIAAGTGNNPLAGLTGARYAGFSQLPNQSMFGPDGGVSSQISSDWR